MTIPLDKDLEKVMMTRTFKSCEKLNEIQGKNIIPAKVFQNKNYSCQKACIKNYEEKESGLLRSFGIWEILISKIYCYTKLPSAML